MAGISYRGSDVRSGRALPDLVDEVEIAVRLGASRRSIGRMRRRSVLPQTTLLFEGYGIWLWETIEAWAGQPGRGLFQPDDPPSIDLVAVGEIATRLDVEPPIVSNWYASRVLPPADYQWEIGRAWLWATIEHWRAGPGRLTSLIVRRQRDPISVESRIERPLVSVPIGGHQPDTDPLEEFERLKTLFLKKSAESRSLVAAFRPDRVVLRSRSADSQRTLENALR